MVDRKVLQLQIGAEEQPVTNPILFLCPWCKKPGIVKNGALHEAFYKRSDNVPGEVLFSRENMVVLHNVCHSQHGQTKEMTRICLELKLKHYDIFAWVDRLINSGQVKHRPDIYGFARNANEKSEEGGGRPERRPGDP